MIKQASIGLDSMDDVNPFDNEGFLPLITAPMTSVVDENNYQVFLDNKIQVCLPRDSSLQYNSTEYFSAISLEDFRRYFIDAEEDIIPDEKYKICIDTSNGNMPQLHETIRVAKALHGNNLVIMAGNVGSVEAFVELAKTGCDYIRVGLGGDASNITSNTGVGHKDLKDLIYSCLVVRYRDSVSVKEANKEGVEKYYNRNGVRSVDVSDVYQNQYNVSRVKIVADGISTYVKQCESKYGFNDNGYAAINNLLNAGADLVMIGKLFAQCVESAGEKDYAAGKEIRSSKDKVKYSGVSTQQEQRKYKRVGTHGSRPCTADDFCKDGKDFPETIIKPSEGSVQWIPVRWTLDEWLTGSDKQDESPYLMGFVNALRTMMAYTNKKEL